MTCRICHVVCIAEPQILGLTTKLTLFQPSDQRFGANTTTNVITQPPHNLTHTARRSFLLNPGIRLIDGDVIKPKARPTWINNTYIHTLLFFRI